MPHLRRLLLSVIAAASLLAQQPETRAKEVLQMILTEKFDALFELFTPEMQSAVTLPTLKERIGPQLKSLGTPKNIGEPVIKAQQAMTTVVIPVNYAPVSLNFTVTFNAEGRIAGLLMQPRQVEVKWTLPAYAKPSGTARTGSHRRQRRLEASPPPSPCPRPPLRLLPWCWSTAPAPTKPPR